MDNSDNNRLRELVSELANTINNIFSGNQEIKNVLKDIEDEGYHVDLILASITRIHKKEELLKVEYNSYDKSFLQSIKIRFGEENYNN